MRVSACGYFATTLDEALDLARKSAEVSHNHPEGIKGAQSIASAIFLARQHLPKETIREYIAREFGYDMDRSCDDIRPDYGFDDTCQGSCPEAIIAFLDSTDFEDAIRLAVSLGGDSDTIGAMTGRSLPPTMASPIRLLAKPSNTSPRRWLRCSKSLRESCRII